MDRNLDVELLIRKVARQERELRIIRKENTRIKKDYRKIQLSLNYLEPIADEFYRRRDEEAKRAYA